MRFGLILTMKDISINSNLNALTKSTSSSRSTEFKDIVPWNRFGLKEDDLSQRHCQNQLSHLGLSRIEQECQESLIRGKIHNQQKFEGRPQIFIKQSFRELCDSKLSGLHAFDNMAITRRV